MSCEVGCTVLCFETDELERASGLETSRAPYSSHKTSSSMRQIQGDEGRKNQTSATKGGMQRQDEESSLKTEAPGSETMES